MSTKIKYFFFIIIFVIGATGFLFYNVYSIKYYSASVEDQKNHSIERENIEKSIIRNLLPQNKADTIRLLFFGDMMLDRHVGERLNGKIDYLFEKIFSATSTIQASSTEDKNTKLDFFEYDVVGCNLEGAVTNNGSHYLPLMEYDFAFHPDLVKQLKDYNISTFNLANNHFTDQGARGIIETRENLSRMGLNYFGCQDGKVGDCSYQILEIKNEKIGLIGFSMVYGKLDEELVKEIVSQVASSSDYVIVNIHWGKEYEHEINITQNRTAHFLVDSGADIVIGHHPHIVQGLEIYKDKPIFYSLGNFIFDQYFSYDTQEGLAVAIEPDKDLVNIDLIPFISRLSQVEIMDIKAKEKFFKRFLDISVVEQGIAEQIYSGNIKIKYENIKKYSR
jgi:poly-gamma-glutamate synthesis protein (capsule biosynthesis protein)